MRTKLDEQLEVLNREMITMGAFCEDAIAYAMEVLFVETMSRLPQVERLEAEIDQKQRDIEALCMKVLLQQQPVAGDLRTIRCAIHMVSDMERIGDQALDIAEIARYCKEDSSKFHVGLRQMADAARNMVTKSVDAYVKQDFALAESVIADDDIVDGYFDQIKQELIDLMKKEEAKASLCFDLLMIAKYLERIGDHATNLAEQIIAFRPSNV